MRTCLIVLTLFFAADATVAQPKGPAGKEGFDEAVRDVEELKEKLKMLSPAKLVESFIPSGPKKYGGYEYYYKSMANVAIRAELAARGESARGALQANVADKTLIWEAINGPGDTVGRICSHLLEQIDE